MVPSFIQIMAVCIPLQHLVRAAASWACPDPSVRLVPALIMLGGLLSVPRGKREVLGEGKLFCQSTALPAGVLRLCLRYQHPPPPSLWRPATPCPLCVPLSYTDPAT